MLRECAGVRVLATSREGLGVPGELVWPLRSLSVAEEPTLDAVAASEAARLFVDRALGTGAGVVLDASNVAAGGGMCGALEGGPAAPENAAARGGRGTTAVSACRAD